MPGEPSEGPGEPNEPPGDLDDEPGDPVEGPGDPIDEPPAEPPLDPRVLGPEPALYPLPAELPLDDEPPPPALDRSESLLPKLNRPSVDGSP